MSQAFVREADEEWLHSIQPTMAALINYLTRENNGIRVYQKSSSFSDKTGREVYAMSNGYSYTKDNDGRWMMV